MEACIGGNTETVRFLLKYNFNINQMDHCGNTAIDLAAEQNLLNACLMLNYKTSIKENTCYSRQWIWVDRISRPIGQYIRYTSRIFEIAENKRKEYILKNPLLNSSYQETLSYIELAVNQLTENSHEVRDELKLIEDIVKKTEDLCTVLARNKDKHSIELIRSLAQVREEINQYSKIDKPTQIYLKSFDSIKQVLNTLRDAETEMDNNVYPIIKREVEKNACFPGKALVTLSNGEQVAMTNLRVGDRVLSRDSSGQLVYEEVYMFGHQEHTVSYPFVTLHTPAHSVSVTGDHYVFCQISGQKKCIPAKLLKVGDIIFIACHENLIRVPITEITHAYDVGLYAPFTRNGTIVVNSTLMSCYVQFLSHDTSHQVLAPLRALHTFPLAFYLRLIHFAMFTPSHYGQSHLWEWPEKYLRDLYFKLFLQNCSTKLCPFVIWLYQSRKN